MQESCWFSVQQLRIVTDRIAFRFCKLSERSPGCVSEIWCSYKRIVVPQIYLQFAPEIVSHYLHCGFHAKSVVADKVTDYQDELLISSGLSFC